MVFYLNYSQLKNDIMPFFLSDFFLIINLSSTARSGGNKNRIISVAQKVPSEIDLQILLAIAVVRLPTIAVTIIRIEAEVNIAPIDFS